MPQALLIGGPLHDAFREVSGDRCTLTVSETRRPGMMTGRGWCTPKRIERETAVYVRLEQVEGVYVAEGYEPTPEDVELVQGWLAMLAITAGAKRAQQAACGQKHSRRRLGYRD